MMVTAGTRLGAYEILGPLGAGGMGEVYRARDIRLGREVAIKLVSERSMGDPDAAARLEREARAVAALSHPNIVALHDIGTDRGCVFAVMELLEGEPLDRQLARERVSWRTAVEIAAAVADGLASAHARGFVHRDLKPANLFVTRDGLVKILDFGLARRNPLEAANTAAVPTADTEPGVVLGTIGYMSPEQVKGESADHRSDIFSLGCVLYEMLAGTPPFRRDTPSEALAAILRDAPPALTSRRDAVPPRVGAIVARCLEKDPDRRFQSARDLAFALREALSGTEPERRRAVGRTAWLGAAGALLLVAAVMWAGARIRTLRADSVTIRSLAAARRDVAPAAYDAYVRGRHAWDKRTEPDLREAIRWFQQSVDADPTYAPAYAGMADAYAQIGYGSYVSPEDAFPRARAAAQRALELDPKLAEAHASLGFALMYYDWNFPESEAEFKRAIALNPSLAVAHQWYAYLLTAMERPLSEADREISSARSLDPLSVPVRTDWAYILHYYGKDQDALRSVQLALEMNPHFPLAYFWLGRIYANQGRYAEAEAALGNIGPLRAWTPAMAALGYARALAGHRADANAVLAEFDDLSRKGRYASTYAIAVVYAGLGDRERVFTYLDAAVRERSHWLVWLKRDPRWNGVRSDPRFDALVRKVGLPSR